MKFKTFNWKGAINYPISTNFIRTKSIFPLMAEKITELFPNAEQFNLIARGSSGAIIASALGLLLDVPCRMYYIRKENESHHWGPDALIFATHTNIIVDDFICTGETMHAILKGFKEITNLKIHAVAITTRLDESAKEKFRNIFKGYRNLIIIGNNNNNK
jgi:adenine/guanine phosphoribosyltransferase-like PRPP-binding protein